MTSDRIDIACLFVLINVCAVFMWRGERQVVALAEASVRTPQSASAGFRIIDQSEALRLAAANRAYLLGLPVDGYNSNGGGLTLTTLMEQVITKKLEKSQLLIVLVSKGSIGTAGSYRKALASVWEGEIAASIVSPTELRR